MGNLDDEAIVALRVVEENQVVDQEPKSKKTKILEQILNPNPWSPWSKIFLISCVIGVAIDPFFLYIPILDEDKKCVKMDEKMKTFALFVRTATDMAYVLHFTVRIGSAFAMAKDSSIFDVLPWSYLLIDILAILPIPQARPSLVYGALYYLYSIFRETNCWNDACKSEAGCVSSAIFDCDKYITTPSRNLTLLKEKCPVDPPNAEVYDFGIFANAIGAHIFGAGDFLKKLIHCFWWGLRNMSSLGQNLETSGFTWENCFSIFISLTGLLIVLYLIGNLQTYMQLQTTQAEETRKKMNDKEQEIRSYLSNYKLPKHKMKIVMQLLHSTIEEEDEDRYSKLKHLLSLLEESKESHDRQQTTESFAEWMTNVLDEKKLEQRTLERSAELWISRNKICGNNLRKTIMGYVRLRMRHGKDVDIGNLLPVLPLSHRMSLKKHLCWDTLNKVPMLENLDTKVYETICNYVRPKIYQENSYIIRKGEPIGFMLFFTQGVVWSFEETNHPERLERGDYYGEQLLEWRLKSTSYSAFPMSSRNVMSQTKVEALALTATDLDHVLSKCWSKFSHSTPSVLEGLTPFAIRSMRELRRRHNFELQNEA
ncbi:hypothetical protein L484_007293 [Morus notabilis]|uniref:Cyclic nucleotide-binding domain-containing protein n=1 Tax=Morus notabilis TaxID=981085 RepID=W9QLN5_9ROSA|nr:hypothetical protein L484_007293 [Morus notabilis]